ncbi:hypothetical protein [Streptomyces sp. NPDC056628]
MSHVPQLHAGKVASSPMPGGASASPRSGYSLGKGPVSSLFPRP